MKKIMIVTLFALAVNAKAQITYEFTYDSASIFTYGDSVVPTTQSQLMIIKFETLGEKYVKINRWSRMLEIFNMDHSVYKNISLSSLPTIYGASAGLIGDVIYISEQLFDTDAKIEFMYTAANVNPNASAYTGIYNEDGILLFSDTGMAGVRINFHQQQFPIYNTSVGTKMILSYKYNPNPNDLSAFKAKVFNLPGTLTPGIQEGNNMLLAQSSISNAYPNPAINTTRVDYKLPDGVNQGEIIFYDLQGKEVKRYKVDRTFTHLLISTADLPAGTYLYQLQTNQGASGGKKMVVVK